jgi:hypothetical protein
MSSTYLLTQVKDEYVSCSFSQNDDEAHGHCSVLIRLFSSSVGCHNTFVYPGCPRGIGDRLNV